MTLGSYLNQKINDLELLARTPQQETRTGSFPCPLSIENLFPVLRINGVKSKLIGEIPITMSEAADGSLQGVATRVSIQHDLTVPMNTLIAQVTPLLDEAAKVVSMRVDKEHYEALNAQATRDTAEAQARTEDLNREIGVLREAVEEFSLRDKVNAMNAKQKAHILTKIWGSAEEDSAELVDLIKELGFDPNYSNRAGESLVDVVLRSNDEALLDLLMANGLNLNQLSGEHTLFQKILASGNDLFIQKMLDSADVSKAVLKVVLDEDVATLAVVFASKPELAMEMHTGYTLLQCALVKGCHNAARQIMDSNPDTIYQLSGNGATAFSLMLMKEDREGIDLLAPRIELTRELEMAISGNRGFYFQKLLESYSHLATENYDGLSLERYSIEHGGVKILSAILQMRPELKGLSTTEGKDLLFYALSQNKLELAKLMLSSSESDALSVLRIAVDEGRAELAHQLCILDESLLNRLSESDNNSLTQELLSSEGFLEVVDVEGNDILHLACRNGNQDLVASILTADPGCVNKQNSAGQTALHILLESEHDSGVLSGIASIIASHHPDIQVLDTDGHTIGDLALENAETLAMLYELGLSGAAEDPAM